LCTQEALTCVQADGSSRDGFEKLSAIRHGTLLPGAGL
jgi:hypothetical protein